MATTEGRFRPLDREADVVIVGGGAAGLMAALEVARVGRRAVLIDKLIPGRSGSSPTSGGELSAALGSAATYAGVGEAPQGDSVAAHVRDTLSGGAFLNDPALVETWASQIVPLIHELEELGVRFSKDESGKFLLSRPMGHSFPRSVAPIGGSIHLLGTMRKEALHRGVAFLQNTAALRLFKIGGAAAGVLAMDTKTLQPIIVRAPVTILAAGSCTSLLKYASASYKTTGDGYVMALHAGCRLANMEFMEFTVIPKVRNYVIASGGISPMVGRGAVITNGSGERFIERYDPARMERTTRAVLARAIYTEIISGRGPVINDARHFTESVWLDFERTHHLLAKLRSLNVDYRNECFEWVPAVHTFLGGAVTDVDGRTGVPGLFAVGEAATGVHGANRLSSNAIAAYLVFGKRAGRAAVAAGEHVCDRRQAVRAARRQWDDVRSTIADRGERPSEVERTLRDLAWRSIGLVRNETGLAQFVRQVEDLLALPLSGGEGLLRSFEVRSQLETARLVGVSAQVRRESRGQHYREDFPAEQDEWTRWIVWDRRRPMPFLEPVPTTRPGALAETAG